MGVFPLRGEPCEVAVGTDDERRIGLVEGVYEDLIGGGAVEVRDGRLRCDGRPVIVRA